MIWASHFERCFGRMFILAPRSNQLSYADDFSWNIWMYRFRAALPLFSCDVLIGTKKPRAFAFLPYLRSLRHQLPSLPCSCEAARPPTAACLPWHPV
jgi:hypothetical protein